MKTEFRLQSRQDMARSIDRLKTFLAEHGLDVEIREWTASTRTAQMAAEAVGAPVGEIVKSLCIMADDKPILALVAGDQRADMGKIAHTVTATVARMANAEQVRKHTGYAIGGVAPFGHTGDGFTAILVDQTLLRFQHVWVAAGTPNAVFQIAVEKLIELTQGRVAEIVE